MAKNVTKNVKFSKVMQTKSLKDFSKMLLPVSQRKLWPAKQKSFEQLGKEKKNWNLDTVIEGLNCLLQHAEPKPKIYYYVYSVEEINKDHSKRNVGIVWFPVSQKKQFALICPGGAYERISSLNEGFPIAWKLNQAGYSAFILFYRCGKDAHYPNPIDDVAASIKYIHENADSFNVEKNDYAVIGFSAGGHAVSNFGTEVVGWKHYGLTCPKTLVLSYPVVTMGQYAHQKTKEYFLGKKQGKIELQVQYSPEMNVTKNYPSTYIFSCEEDSSVDILNSKMLASSLEKAKVSYKLNLSVGSTHGIGLGIGSKAEGWFDEAVRFWSKANNR